MTMPMTSDDYHENDNNNHENANIDVLDDDDDMTILWGMTLLT